MASWRFLALAALVLVGGAAWGGPKIKAPTLAELLASDMVARARIRWTRIDPGGGRTVVEVLGGEAFRSSPGLSPEPQPLPYDLGRNRKLVEAIRAAHPQAAAARRPPRDGDRVLELLGEGEDWVAVFRASQSPKEWQKGHWAPVWEQLEPLLQVQADVFKAMKKP